MTPIRTLILLLAAMAAGPAGAADVVFPTGSRIGLIPPPGMAVSQRFFGFEDRDNKVAIIIVPLPAPAYRELARSTEPGALQTQGVTLEKREDVTLSFGAGTLVVGEQMHDSVKLHKWIMLAGLPDMTAVVTAEVPDAARTAYPDEAVRAALVSVAVRPRVPVEEQLSLLPFKVTELADFRISGLAAGRAIMLGDAVPGTPASFVDTHIVISMAPGGPALPADRETFARDAFAAIPNISDVRIVSAEPLRIGNQQGHQIMAHAKDANGAEITVVQWLRFGGGAYMQMVGVAPTVDWLKAYQRFRQVRDGIEQR
jgi:hypothetical protein